MTVVFICDECLCVIASDPGTITRQNARFSVSENLGVTRKDVVVGDVRVLVVNTSLGFLRNFEGVRGQVLRRRLRG
jgi:hypothetical protein